MKLFWGLLLSVFARMHAMEELTKAAVQAYSSQEVQELKHAPVIKQEFGFNTQHYKDFLKCYFNGKETEEIQTCYMNFCLRDRMWSVYKNFLDNGGMHVLNMMERPTTDSTYDFKCAKGKLMELDNGIKRSLGLIAQLESEFEKKQQKNHRQKKKK